MNRITNILRAKKMQGINWETLSEPLPIGSAGLRAAFSRGSVDDAYLEELEKILGLTHSEVNEPDQTYTLDEGSIEEIIFRKIKPMIDELLKSNEERMATIEKKQKSIRKDFHLMFERQLGIDKLKSVGNEDKNISGN